MPKCPYCARPLRGFGVKCRACRRYVLRWSHLVVLGAVVIIAVVVLLEALLRVL
jgi:hypothetical protein